MSPLISRQRYRGGRGLPEWVQKWVRFNESVLNIKNKMASLSSIFPIGIGYNAGDRMSFGREAPSARKSSISGPIKLRATVENAVLWNWSCRDLNRRSDAARSAMHCQSGFAQYGDRRDCPKAPFLHRVDGPVC